MNLQLQTSIEQACASVISAYAVALDCGEKERLVSLFVSDGVLRSGGRVLRGASELPDIIGAREPDLVLRHHLTTISIDVTDDDSARGLAYYMLFKASGTALPLTMEQPFSIGEWTSQFTRTETGWKLAEHEIRRLFVRPS